MQSPVIFKLSNNKAHDALLRDILTNICGRVTTGEINTKSEAGQLAAQMPKIEFLQEYLTTALPEVLPKLKELLLETAMDCWNKLALNRQLTSKEFYDAFAKRLQDKDMAPINDDVHSAVKNQKLTHDESSFLQGQVLSGMFRYIEGISQQLPQALPEKPDKETPKKPGGDLPGRFRRGGDLDGPRRF